MPVTLLLPDAVIFTALRSFLLSILPAGVEVIRGQDNRVAEPSAVDFVTMTPLMRERLGTNVATYVDPYPAPGGTRTAEQPTKITVQLDVHGPASADNAQIIATLLRDDYGCLAIAAFNPLVQPLYASDPRQVPFVNGEGQFEDRWTIDAVFQASAGVQMPQDFAGTLTIQPAIQA